MWGDKGSKQKMKMMRLKYNKYNLSVEYMGHNGYIITHHAYILICVYQWMCFTFYAFISACICTQQVYTRVSVHASEYSRYVRVCQLIHMYVAGMYACVSLFICTQPVCTRVSVYSYVRSRYVRVCQFIHMYVADMYACVSLFICTQPVCTRSPDSTCYH